MGVGVTPGAVLRIVALLVVVGALGWGERVLYRAGYAAAELDQAEAAAELQARLDDAAADMRLMYAAILDEQRQQSDLERRMVRDAMADPDADRQCLGAGSVQRLDEIR